MAQNTKLIACKYELTEAGALASAPLSLTELSETEPGEPIVGIGAVQPVSNASTAATAARHSRRRHRAPLGLASGRRSALGEVSP